MRLLILVFLCEQAMVARAQDGPETGQVTPPKSKLIAVDEVHIQQEAGRLSNTTKSPVPVVNASGKTAPEGAAVAATPAGSTSPNTCDPKNASSPACYTATQQGHAK